MHFHSFLQAVLTLTFNYLDNKIATCILEKWLHKTPNFSYLNIFIPELDFKNQTY